MGARGNKDSNIVSKRTQFILTKIYTSSTRPCLHSNSKQPVRWLQIVIMRIVRTNLLIVIITKPNPMHGQILKHHSLETCIKLKVHYSAAQASQRVVWCICCWLRVADLVPRCELGLIVSARCLWMLMNSFILWDLLEFHLSYNSFHFMFQSSRWGSTCHAWANFWYIIFVYMTGKNTVPNLGAQQTDGLVYDKA